MKIRDLQRDIEESLASVPTSTLPNELSGLRHLPVNDRNPQVSIRNVVSKRKVREDASASYFDPDSCELVISFVTIEDPEHGPLQSEPGSAHSEAPDDLDFEAATDQLIDQLKTAERTRPFVGLKWFRDQFLPNCGHNWARDTRASGALLRYATEQRLILTSQVPNPNQPLYPVTAIRVNRRHPRFQPNAPTRSARFRPVPIRGGPISETVINDRR
jgi:hypothetical protein